MIAEMVEEVFQDVRQLSEANERRVHALESLFETARHLSLTSSPEAVYGYLTERVSRVLQAREVLLWSYDEARRVLTPLLPARHPSENYLASDLASRRLSSSGPFLRCHQARFEARCCSSVVQ